jgi:hypothetical protein
MPKNPLVPVSLETLLGVLPVRIAETAHMSLLLLDRQCLPCLGDLLVHLLPEQQTEQP